MTSTTTPRPGFSRRHARKIGVVAPSCTLDPAVADRVQALAKRLFGDAAPEIAFHQQCFVQDGHFAGSDAVRAAAFVQVANDPTVDAVWFARGGYGAGRLIDAVLPHLNDTARGKTYLGYSDAGAMLGALYAAGVGRNSGCVAHGPMPADIKRADGEAAVERSLRWLVTGDAAGVEMHVPRDPADHTPVAAFNLAILASLLGTVHQPDLNGHIVMIEDIAEYMYRIDRMMFQITSSAMMRGIKGLRMGRMSDIPTNDPDFGTDEEAVVRDWCSRSGIAFMGFADIGHDADNKIVPFG